MRVLVPARWVLAAALFADLGWSVASATDTDTNVYILELAGKGTLADVYASGLRPRRWDSSGHDECFVEDKFLAFKLPQSGSVSIFAYHCDFKVFADGRLRSVEAQSPNMTVETARQWMKPIVSTLGGSAEQLDSYLDLVSTGDWETEQKLRIEGSGSDFYVGTPWPGAESDLPALSVSMRWRWDEQYPIVIHATVTWARPYSSMRYPSKPLEPPPGFEEFPIRTEPYVAEALRRSGESGFGSLPDSVKKKPAGQIGLSGVAENDRESASNGATGSEALVLQPPGVLGPKTWVLLFVGVGCCALLWLALYRKSSK